MENWGYKDKWEDVFWQIISQCRRTQRKFIEGSSAKSGVEELEEMDFLHKIKNEQPECWAKMKEAIINYNDKFEIINIGG